MSAVALFLALLAVPLAASGQGFVQDTVTAFKNSNIEFQRGNSQVPFFPLATLVAKSYGSAELERDGESAAEFDVETINQAAGLPLLINDNNALVIGEYLSRTRFSGGGPGENSFNVDSVGLGLAWLGQINTQWQAAAFVMPLAHKSSQQNGDWNWQYLGGAFGRYVQSDTLWWVFGFYADVGSDEDTYLPYVGASWSVNEHWTLSAILPWPAVLYAPNNDWLLRLGATPSGASWRVDSGSGKTSINFDAWDFGLTVEKRVAGNFWLGLEGGIGGLRGLRLSGGSLQGVDVNVSSSGFVGLNLNFRPSVD